MSKKFEEEYRNARIQHTISLIFVCVMFLTFISYMTYLVLPVKIYENLGPYMKIVTPEVRAGEDVVYISNFCKYKEFPAHIDKQLVNHVIIYYNEGGSNFKLGCHTSEIHTEIPIYTPPGEYYIRTIITYDLPLLKKEIYTIESEPFRVIE